MRFAFVLSFLACGAPFVLCDPVISSFPNSLTLCASFDPIKAAYWTGLPHHRRTPFSVSPDGKSAYLAYLDSTYKNVQVQQVDVSSFAAVGSAVTIPGFEAAGLVAQNDGFALMLTTTPAGTTDLPPNNYLTVSLVRYKTGKQAWSVPLNGPGVYAAKGVRTKEPLWLYRVDTILAHCDSWCQWRLSLLVCCWHVRCIFRCHWYVRSALLSVYILTWTAYTGFASGHFGDSVRYVNDTGVLQNIASSSTFGCSHNTGIGVEDADAAPFASVCAEDHGAIWLNTDTRYMSGVKVASENTTNGVSGEPSMWPRCICPMHPITVLISTVGGMSGSYSNLARFPTTSKYVFDWQSRGALNLYTDTGMGAPYTQCSPRWLNHNVAIALMSSKDTLAEAQASSVVGASEGDSQVNWITKTRHWLLPNASRFPLVAQELMQEHLFNLLMRLEQRSALQSFRRMYLSAAILSPWAWPKFAGPTWTWLGIWANRNLRVS